jgi:hypothetical protein
MAMAKAETTNIIRSLVAGAAALPALAVPAMALENQSPVTVTEPDPIFAAIEAYRFWNKRSDELWGNHSGKTTPEMRAAVDAAVEARLQLCSTPPTTIAGLAALLGYAMSEQERLGIPLPDDHDDTMALIESLAQCVRGLAVQS